MIKTERKLLLLTAIFIFAVGYFCPAIGQENSTPAAQNFHQWGAVTLFNGLPSDKVRAIAQTSDGVLWFGTDNGLSRFDGRRVQTVALDAGEIKKISSLETSPDGILWIGTENGVFIGQNGKFERIEGTENSPVNSILLGEKTFVALANGQILKLTKTNGENFNVEKIPDQTLLGSDGQALNITSLADKSGQILAGTRSRSFLSIENNQAFEIFSRPRPFFVNAFAKDKQGKLWLGADADKNSSGLYLLEDLKNPQKIGDVTGNVLSIASDEANGVWVGTESKGLFRFRGGQPLEHFTFENTSGGLRSNTIFALYVDREGVIWIGTNRGSCRYDSASPFNQTISDNSNSNFVRTLFKSENGQIFTGTNRGLFALINDNWTEAENFSNKTVFAIGEDISGQILIGTSNGLFDLTGKQKMTGAIRAIASFQGKTYAAVFGRGIVQVENQTQVFAENSPTELFADEKNLWIGTAQNGVFKFNGTETKPAESLENLRGGAVRKITEDAENNLWAAGEKGLFRYQNGRSETIIANQIVQDFCLNGADIWAATEGGGLIHARRDDVFGWLVSSLNAEQGLPSQKIFSILPLENRLLLGTNRGVVFYTPTNNPPKIIPARILSRRLHEPEELNGTIALDYPQNTLLVEVAGLSSRTFPEQFQYGFVLKNANGEILDKKISSDSQFAPANLTAGEYVLETRAFNKDLLVSEPLIIKFSVARAPFPRIAASLGVLLVIALTALIWAIIERRRITLRNRQLAAARFDLANEAERERKRIAGDLHDQTLADLRNLMMMSDKLPSDTSVFRQEVETISEEIRRICEDLSPSVLENVGFFAALEFLVKHTIENSRFSADGADENLNFSANVQMQIYRIAQEVLTNIKNHSDAKFVEMQLIVSETDIFHLTIKDDGTPFQPVQNSAKGRGIGNIKSRAAIIEAEIFWREDENSGTIFQLNKSI